MSLVVGANGILSQLSEILEATAVAEQGQSPIADFIDIGYEISVVLELSGQKFYPSFCHH